MISFFFFFFFFILANIFHSLKFKSVTLDSIKMDSLLYINKIDNYKIQSNKSEVTILKVKSMNLVLKSKE
jgi:hypothetical protein